MKVRHEVSALPFLLFIPVLSSAITLDCDRIVVNRMSWDLSPLAGPHSVFNTVEHPPTTINTTYTIDLCKPLKDTECPSGTRVCGVQRSSGENKILGAIPIAGNYVQSSGRTLDPKITRLKMTDSQQDGLRIELHGGSYPFNGKEYKQKAVIEMICDHESTGLENDWAGRGIMMADEKESEVTKPDDKDDKVDDKQSLSFKSYAQVDEMFVLRLDWRTRYVCEDFQHGDRGKSNHWGFFTWLVIIVFLFTAAYLIFGSWLNYNRYGARGWDLLPHGDTIRDVPYILKDWGRKVVSTVQGPGSRGGYSAV
ncbi:hypothetical protein GX48_07206 [Paracoccidioides brasiliensis]|nr:hypothetical protein GX48_07206 [Paracoccidioides brasiliensis]